MRCPKCNPHATAKGGWMALEAWPRDDKNDLNPRGWLCRDCSWRGGPAEYKQRGWKLLHLKDEYSGR